MPPRPPNAHLERGKLLLERRRFKMAETELRRALALDPESGVVHAYLALCLLEDPARVDEALTTALWGTTKELFNPAPWYAASAAYERKGDLDGAERTLRVALSANPETPALYAALARVLLGRERTREALETAEHGVSMVPGHVGCLQVMGTALARLGRHGEADAAFRLALERDPEDAPTHNSFGWALLRRGDAAEAVRRFREALRLDPGMPPARAGLTEALKARNPVYRLFLRASLKMPAMPHQLKWAAVTLAVLAVCVLEIAAHDLDLPRAVMLPLEVLVVAAAVLTWTAEPLFDLLLFTDPLGRHALDGWQRAGAVAVAAVLAVAAALGVAAVAVDGGKYGFPAVLAVFHTIVITAVLRASPGRARWGTLAFAAAATGLYAYALFLHAREAEAFGLAFGFSISAAFCSDMVCDELSRRFKT